MVWRFISNAICAPEKYWFQLRKVLTKSSSHNRERFHAFHFLFFCTQEKNRTIFHQNYDFTYLCLRVIWNFQQWIMWLKFREKEIGWRHFLQFNPLRSFLFAKTCSSMTERQPNFRIDENLTFKMLIAIRLAYSNIVPRHPTLRVLF